MIIDTSAALAVLFREPDARRLEDAIANAWPRRMSAATLLEAAMVVEIRGGTAASHELDVVLERAEVELVPLTRVRSAPRLAAFRQG